MKTWTKKLDTFKAKALDSLTKIWTLADTTKGIGVAFQINDTHFTNLCYFANEWMLIDGNGVFVSAYNVNTDRLMSIIDEIHKQYKTSNKLNF